MALGRSQDRRFDNGLDIALENYLIKHLSFTMQSTKRIFATSKLILLTRFFRFFKFFILFIVNQKSSTI